ncbi:MAG: gliding motility-associated-like protein, partial [Flavobacteriales bacterium]
TLEVAETNTYSVVVESECDVVSDDVEVYFEQCGCLIYVPNAFTPDQDGLNEYFAIQSECTFERFNLLIFNRNGEVIFTSSEPETVWDGSNKNGDYFVPDGVYVYQIEYSTTTLEGLISEVLTGHVTVLR